jgi:hypothetical protein
MRLGLAYAIFETKHRSAGCDPFAGGLRRTDRRAFRGARLCVVGRWLASSLRTTEIGVTVHVLNRMLKLRRRISVRID